MSVYKMIETPDRGARYWKDKRFVKKENIPTDILPLLESGKDVPDAAERVKGGFRVCLFCGVDAKLTRTLDAKVLFFCEEHYYDNTIGKVAQKVRELQEA